MRYIQHPLTLKLVPADEYIRPKETQHSIWNDLDSFVSPVDGSVISDRKQLAEHNKRNNVVSSDNYSPEFYARKTAEREESQNGKVAVKERRSEMYELMMRRERGH
jgi:hypothetical protein